MVAARGTLFVMITTPISRGSGASGAVGDPFARRGLARSPPTREENGVEVASLHGTSTTSAVRVGSQSEAQAVNTPGEPLTGIRLVANQLDEIIEFASGRTNISKDLKQKLLVLRQSVQEAKLEHDTLTRRLAGGEKGVAGPFSFLSGKAATQEVMGITSCVSEGRTVARPKRVRQQSEGGSGNVKRRLTVTDGGKVELERAPDRRERAPNRAKPRGKGNGAAQANTLQGDVSRPAAAAQRTENPWQLVSRVKRKEGPHPARKLRDKGEALLVKTDKERYADVLRTMRGAERLSALGEDVRSVRRTKAGELILVLKRGAQASGTAYKRLAQEVLGEGVEVRSLGT